MPHIVKSRAGQAVLSVEVIVCVFQLGMGMLVICWLEL